MTTVTETPRKRIRRHLGIAALVLAVPVLALAWWLIAPLFQDTVVNEGFPISADDPTRVASPETLPSPSVPDEPAAADVAQPAVDDIPAEDQPVAIATGTFQGADDFHQGSGTAVIYRLEDGAHVLRFEDFDVTNGPDLHVLISSAESISSRDGLEAAGYTDLGKLKGNQGNQNYELPADLDLTGPLTITIYCEPFHVVFATAALTPAG